MLVSEDTKHLNNREEELQTTVFACLPLACLLRSRDQKKEPMGQTAP
jgi:hypothetical protein